jgi:hypothetical protein
MKNPIGLLPAIARKKPLFWNKKGRSGWKRAAFPNTNRACGAAQLKAG